MKSCTRIEIVIETPLVDKMIEVLRKARAPGYTLLQDVRGAGDRGVRRGDALVGDSSNSLFIIACDDEQAIERIVEGVRPLLSRSGGICLTSAANWLRH